MSKSVNDLSKPVLRTASIASYDFEYADDEVSRVVKYQGLQEAPLRKYLYLFFSALFVGFPLLVLYWMPKLKMSLFYKKSSFDKASHAALFAPDGNVYFSRVERRPAPQSSNAASRVGAGKELAFVEFRHMTYFHDEEIDRFCTMTFDYRKTFREFHTVFGDGLSEEECERRMADYGGNRIEIPLKSIPRLLIEEILHPFFVFQIFSIAVWLAEYYIYYAACIFILATCSAISSLVQTRQNMSRLKQMAEMGTMVTVVRDGEMCKISSDDIVPGDAIVMEDHMQVPCDIMLLNGQCVVNESNLTGESIPIIKTGLPFDGGIVTNVDDFKRYVVFSGTTVIQSKAFRKPHVLGISVQTSFSTAKGKLVRYILFPKPSFFQFYQDAFKFVGCLALLALIGFTFCIFWYIKLGVPPRKIIIRALDLITIVVPPALVVALSSATVFSVNRLKKQGIYCISPPRVNVAGKGTLMCFDKTGTLTEDGLDLYGFLPRGGELKRSAEHLEENFFEAVVSCHALTTVHGEIVGDPLEVKIFESTGWKLEIPSISEEDSVVLCSVSPPQQEGVGDEGKKEFGILRRFDFSSHLQRMSAIVKDPSTGRQWLMCKGSPETIRSLLSEDAPPDELEDPLKELTSSGFRVLAYGVRDISSIKYRKAMKMDRSDLEKDLKFIGLVILENHLKENTQEIIQILSNASIRNVMVTGDNVYTAVSVGKKCHIVDSKRPVFIGQKDSHDNLVWRNADHPLVELSTDDLLYSLASQDIQLALVGTAYEWMLENLDHDVVTIILLKTCVLARMSPDSKTSAIEAFQGMDYVVGMCGDGANDCGALKQAHFGLSLSEAEASIAAPFTSLDPTIASVVKLIREGRCSLATSFQLFKFVALYSMIQFISVILLYKIDSNLGDFMFLWIDLFMILPLTIFMGWSRPSDNLAPRRPSGRLISKRILVSLVFHVLLCAIFQIGVFLYMEQQPWFTHLHQVPSRRNIVCYESTVVFVYANFQYLWVAISFSIAKPFRKSLWTNIPYTLAMIALFAMCTVILMCPTSWMREFFQLRYLPVDFRIHLLVIALVNFAVDNSFERFIISTMFPSVARCGRPKGVPSRLYKRIERNLKNILEAPEPSNVNKWMSEVTQLSKVDDDEEVEDSLPLLSLSRS